MEDNYKILVSGIAPTICPTETFFGLLDCGDDNVLEIPKRYPFRGEWGEPSEVHLGIMDVVPMPSKLDIVWLSISEKKFYSIEKALSVNKMKTIWSEFNARNAFAPFEYIIVGMAPYGKVALWFYNYSKSVVVEWLNGEQVNVSMKDFLPENQSLSLETYCKSYSNLLRQGLPPHDLFDNYMKQFTYCYQVRFGQWDEEKEEWCESTLRTHDQELQIPGSDDADGRGADKPQYELDYIEEALYDGTHDKLHDGGLMRYHEAGKPKKLAVRWHAGKKEWTAYFWFEDKETRHVFDRFYSVYPDAKADIIIRIEPEKDKYEMAMYCPGLPEPLVIPEKTFQLLVFRNKLECFRSSNYNQPSGAWIW